MHWKTQEKMNKSSYSIRKAKPEDAGQILKLMKELADYDKTPDALLVGEKEIAEDLSTWYHCILLEYKVSDYEKTEIIGYALWNYCFGWRGRMTYLEDLYVSPNHRGEGLGYSLIQSVAKKAHDRGCDHLRFTVLGWNQQAKKLYKKINAVNETENEERELMQLVGEDLKHLALNVPIISCSD